ncbi:MAG TPA: hypothetical protein VGB64_00660 [Actinomycetota bacterium]
MHPTLARRRVAFAGAVVAVCYVVAASVSGTLSPLARRPLLDGVHSAPPYNWVEAPPDEQGSGTPAADESRRLALKAAGNDEVSIATSDSQAILSMPQGAIKPAEGRTTAEVKLEPLNPNEYLAPTGYTIRGNVYRIAVRSVPGGAGIPTLDPAGQLTMTYAAPTINLVTAQHDIMFSSEGENWRVIGAQDQHATQQVSAPFVDIGYYAAVARIPEDEPPDDAGGGFPWIILVVVVVAAGAAFAATVRIRRARSAAKRRERIRQELVRKSRSTKKRRS